MPSSVPESRQLVVDDGGPNRDLLGGPRAHILKAVQTALSLTRQLLAYSRRHASTPRVTDLGAVAVSMARAAGTVLLTEDDHDVRRYLRDVLVRDGYTVVDAARGERALEAARLAGGIDLLVTDMVMPGMGGVALYQALQATSPGLPVVFMSGHDLQTAPPGGAAPAVLQKPFSTAEFLAAIRRVRGSAGIAPPLAGANQASPAQADSLVAHAKGTSSPC